MTDECMSIQHWWNNTMRAEVLKKPCPIATLSTTNPTRTDLSLKICFSIESRQLSSWAMAWPSDYKLEVSPLQTICLVIQEQYYIYSNIRQSLFKMFNFQKNTYAIFLLSYVITKQFPTLQIIISGKLFSSIYVNMVVWIQKGLEESISTNGIQIYQDRKCFVMF